jgi:hypothetical protein
VTTTTTHTSDEQLHDEPTTPAPAAPPVGAPELPDAGLRAQITPWAAMGALVVAAGAVRLAQHAATGADAEIAYGVAGVAFTVAVVAATVTRKRITDRRLRHRLVAALYLAASWLTMISFTGVTLGAIAALSILGAGLSLLWWREHRIGPGIAPDADFAALERAATDSSDLFVERFNAHLGGKGKPFAGAKLLDPQTIKSGYRFTLELVPGTQSVEQVRGQVNALRGGLRLMPGQDVIVEDHPTEPSPTALLTIVTRPPIAKPQHWPGPEQGFNSKLGAVNLGPFADGEGCACWRVYTQDSMWGGFIQGGTGSGKSRLLEQIAMSCAASISHPTIIWYGDGQNGDSSPMLVEHADYAATTFSQIYNMALAALRIMKINGVERRLSGRVGFAPTAACPGTLMIVDEFHKPLDVKQNPLLAVATQEAFVTIAREGRKNGVALIAATQSPKLEAFGSTGGADTLRACLLDGNGLIMRSKNPNAKQVFGVDINPRKFPKLAGYGYLCDPDPGARSAPFRGFWVTDELAVYWPPRLTWRTQPVRQANFAGKDYAKRREVVAEQRFADEMLLAMADAGSLDEIEALEQTMDRAAAARDTVDVVEFGDGHPPVRRVAKFWEQQPQPGPGRPAELNTGQRRVLEAITAGHASPKEIITATGYSSSQVYNLLGELDKLTKISKAGYGRYQANQTAA